MNQKSSESQELTVYTEPTLTASETTTDIAVGNALHLFNLTQMGVEAILRMIPEMTNEQLVEAIQYTDHTARHLWLLRGKCYEELRERAERLRGGRGVKDEAGRGVTKALTDVAAKVGKSSRLIRDDYRIAKAFFPDDTLPDANDILPRDYYLVLLEVEEEALREEGLEYAKARFQERDFSAMQLKRWLYERMAETATGVPAKTFEERVWMNFGIPRSAYDALIALSKEWECDYNTVVTRCLVDRHLEEEE